MPGGTLRRRVTVAAGSTTGNVLAGETLEFPGRPSAIELAHVASAAGDIEVELFFGNEQAIFRSAVPVEAAAGRGPVIPDDALPRMAAASADRIRLIYYNIDPANPADVEFVINVEPVG